jgi:hypothetical protein
MRATTPMICIKLRPVAFAGVTCASAGTMARNKMSMTLSNVTNDLTLHNSFLRLAL